MKPETKYDPNPACKNPVYHMCSELAFLKKNNCLVLLSGKSLKINTEIKLGKSI